MRPGDRPSGMPRRRSCSFAGRSTLAPAIPDSPPAQHGSAPWRYVQTWQLCTGLDQSGHTCMQHESHRRIDPLHRRAGTCRAIRHAMRKLAADRPCCAKRRECATDFGPFEGRVVSNEPRPLQGPPQMGDQFARQAEGKIKGADPRRCRAQPALPRFERSKALEAGQLYAATFQGAERDDDGFARVRRARKIASKQEHGRDSIRREGCGTPHRVENQCRPTMAAVAISSSSNASDTLPETE